MILLHHEDHSVEGIQGINHPQGLGKRVLSQKLGPLLGFASRRGTDGEEPSTEVSLQGGDREEPK